jgi:sporulation protein YlmC with PRC-barrel domain
MDHSDFEVAKGEPDIRGWDVRDDKGKKIGEVEELIVDAQKKKVRYMLVDLGGNEWNLKHRKILLPIGMAELHKEDDDVIIPGIAPDQVQSIPDYDRDHLDEQTERSICAHLRRSQQTVQSADAQSSLYDNEYFNDDNLYKHRLHEARPATQNSSKADYERGLRLWEMRSETGVVPSGDGEQAHRSEAAHMERCKSRREAYENKRFGSGDHSAKHKTIEDRIRDEGLQGD